ncbi:MAG TPA: LON peptidase substrate-binding domain-containing protein [Thermoanaerobaculia bacterium]|nr:LON peptidase substrate-binding domain-containing protein [Thermoanaerobaculia bacterium]
MTEIPGSSARIPLVALSDVVAFPCTDLELEIRDPRQRSLVRHVIERDREGWVGLVLLKPSWVRSESEAAEIFSAGTAGRVMEVEIFADGRASLRVHGEYRFELEREVGGEPYRQGLVHPIEEPRFDDRDAAVKVVREGIVAFARTLAEGGETSVPFGPERVEALCHVPFEELVNQLAQELDLPALRKLELLTETILDRALSILQILEGRKRVADLLRPYRHLAARSPLN